MAVMDFRIFPAHRHCQEPILDVDSVRRQDEMEPSPFFTIVRQADIFRLIVTYLDFLQKPEKGPKTAVGYFQYLLGYTGLQQAIVFIFLANGVTFFVPQELMGIEVMLPNRIDPYIVQVIAVLAHLPEHRIVLFRQATDDIRLRQVHLGFTSSVIFHYTLAEVKRLRQKRHRVDFAGIEPAKSIAIHPLPKRKGSSGKTGINKKIARQGYITLLDYYAQICKN